MSLRLRSWESPTDTFSLAKVPYVLNRASCACPYVPASVCILFLPMHIVQSSLTLSILGGSKHLKTKFICISQQFLCLSSLGSGREKPFWNSLLEGSTVWILLNKTILPSCCSPCPPRIVPQPFASSASSSSVQ